MVKLFVGAIAPIQLAPVVQEVEVAFVLQLMSLAYAVENASAASGMAKAKNREENVFVGWVEYFILLVFLRLVWLNFGWAKSGEFTRRSADHEFRSDHARGRFFPCKQFQHQIDGSHAHAVRALVDCRQWRG